MKTKNIIFIAIVCTSFLVVIGYQQLDIEDRDKPNIVMIVLETTRARNLPCYGYERNTTPHICDVADDGILFENAYSNAANTPSSVASMFSSKHPYRFYTDTHHLPLPDENVLFSSLEETGYETELYSDFLNQGIVWLDFDINEYDEPLNMNQDVVDDVSSNQSNFAWIHYDNNHFPYTPRNKFDGSFSSTENVNMTIVDKIYNANETVEGAHWKTRELKNEKDIYREIEYIRNRYDDYLKESDYLVNNLLQNLKDEGKYDDSLIIITSDHGESLGEKGNYFEHRELYEPNIQVPLILKLPDNQYAGETVSERISLVNIHKTLMDYLNLSDTVQDELDGRSLLDYVNKDLPNEDVVSRWGNYFSLRKDQYKYIYDAYENEEEELYNISADPREKENLIDVMERPEQIVEFRETIDKNSEKWTYPDNLDDKVDEETLQRMEELHETLAELGYA